MKNRSLLTGVAYHGNRMLSHAVEDMKEIVRADMDIVLHMFSHTDQTRHKDVIRDIISASEYAGLEVWIDNWGLTGPPGDISHFLAYHPECHTYYSDGEMLPTHACLNSPTLRAFIKKWLDDVYSIGGRTVFWDEPHIPMKTRADGQTVFGCACPECKKRFAERYHRPMPTVLPPEGDPDVMAFRNDTIVDYFSEVTAYAASLGMRNVCCVMFAPGVASDFNLLDRICSLPTMENIGTDPYWYGRRDAVPYAYVYDHSKATVEMAEHYGKDHNVWIQTFDVPRGREEEIIQATEAAYDAGARTLLAWGFRGSESNSYRAKNPLRTWEITVEAMKRVRSLERDRILAENRAKYKK